MGAEPVSEAQQSDNFFEKNERNDHCFLPFLSFLFIV